MTDINEHHRVTCYACGRGMSFQGDRFCQPACRKWIRRERPPHDPHYVRSVTNLALSSWVVGVVGTASPNLSKGARAYAHIPVRQGRPKLRRKMVSVPQCPKPKTVENSPANSIGCKATFRDRGSPQTNLATEGAPRTAIEQKAAVPAPPAEPPASAAPAKQTKAVAA
jgi:hypothetical protein